MWNLSGGKSVLHEGVMKAETIRTILQVMIWILREIFDRIKNGNGKQGRG